MSGDDTVSQWNSGHDIVLPVSGLPKLNYPRLTGMYLSIARIKGDATKIEEYVPKRIPTSIAHAKSFKIFVPKISNDMTTSNVKPEVRTVRERV